MLSATTDHLPLVDLENMDTPSLRRELSTALTISAKHLVHLSAIWAELERRGEDLSDLRSGLAIYLPLIASGRVDAEVVVRFAGQTMLLRAIAQMPLERQRALLSGEKIDLAESDGSIRQVSIGQLRSAAVRQVFDAGRIRTATDQQLMLANASAPTKKPHRLKINRTTKTISMAGQHVELGAVIDALAGAYPESAALIRVLQAQIEQGDTRA